VRVSLHKVKGYWRAVWCEAGRQRARGLGNAKTVPRKRALQRCAEIQADLAGGLSADCPTLAEHLAAHAAADPGRAEGTVYLYGLTGRLLCERFGPGARLDSIRPDQARAWRSELLAAGKADSTVRRHMKEAKAIFAQAVADGRLARNPFAALPSSAPAPADKDWLYLDCPQFAAVLDACPNAGWRLLLALCRWAGLRRNEALALRWEDVDLTGRTLTANATTRQATTKKRRRQVPIRPELHDLLFAAWMDGAPAGRIVEGVSDLHRRLGRIAQAAGLTAWDDPFQSLRRAAERDFLAGGAKLPAVAEWMGHSPQVALRHYLRAEAEDARGVQASRYSDCLTSPRLSVPVAGGGGNDKSG